MLLEGFLRDLESLGFGVDRLAPAVPSLPQPGPPIIPSLDYSKDDFGQLLGDLSGDGGGLNPVAVKELLLDKVTRTKINAREPKNTLLDLVAGIFGGFRQRGVEWVPRAGLLAAVERCLRRAGGHCQTNDGMSSLWRTATAQVQDLQRIV